MIMRCWFVEPDGCRGVLMVVFARIGCFFRLLNPEKRSFFIKKFVFFGYFEKFFLDLAKERVL